MQNMNDLAQWAMENLGIKYVNFDGFHINVANEVCRQLAFLKAHFPEVIPEIKWLSTTQHRNKVYKQRTGRIKRVNGCNWATAWRPANGDMQGITFNDKFAGNPILFNASLQKEARGGFHPPNCNTIASVVTHEFAHQLDYWLERNFPEVRKALIASMYKSYSKKFIKEQVSAYASKNEMELFAESFAEWIHSNCNPASGTVRKIGMATEAAFKAIREGSADKYKVA